MTQNVLKTTHIEDLPWNEYNCLVAKVIDINTKVVELQIQMAAAFGTVYRVLKPRTFSAKINQHVDLCKKTIRGRTALRVNKVISKRTSNEM
jgi:hypothetical protein